jgi:putative 4-mercaptohistidine N1-methyltranferase
MNQSLYESDDVLSQYLVLHYGSPDQAVPYPFGPKEDLDFPLRCVKDCIDRKRVPRDAKGLDLGCAVGRSAFELTRYCQEVIAVDKSERFIKAAKMMAQKGELEYFQVEEGKITRRVNFVVPDGLQRSRVRFEVGDAMHLRANIGFFDVVLMANLIDRLPHPRRCISRLSILVKKGGQLIITSPYTWSQQFTAPSEWLGGFEQEGHPVRTRDTLKKELEPDFELVRRRDLPFVIREHARKYQWCVAEATVWVRK